MFSCTLILAPLVYSRMSGPPRALASPGAAYCVLTTATVCSPPPPSSQCPNASHAPHCRSAHCIAILTPCPLGPQPSAAPPSVQAATLDRLPAPPAPPAPPAHIPVPAYCPYYSCCCSCSYVDTAVRPWPQRPTGRCVNDCSVQVTRPISRRVLCVPKRAKLAASALVAYPSTLLLMTLVLPFLASPAPCCCCCKARVNGPRKHVCFAVNASCSTPAPLLSTHTPPTARPSSWPDHSNSQKRAAEATTRGGRVFLHFLAHVVWVS